MKVILNSMQVTTPDGSTMQITKSMSDAVSKCSLSIVDNYSSFSVACPQELIIIDDQVIPNPTVNLLLNPALNPYTVSWNQDTPVSGITLATVGGGGIQYTFSNAANNAILREYQYTAQSAVVGGQTYNISLYANGTSPVNIRIYVQVGWIDVGNNVISSQLATFTVPTTLTRYNASFVAPAGSNTAFIGISGQATSGTNSGTVTFTQMQFEPQWFSTLSYPTPWCGPAQTNCQQLPSGLYIRQYRKFAGFVVNPIADGYLGNARTIQINAVGYAWLMGTIYSNKTYSSHYDSFIIADLLNTYLVCTQPRSGVSYNMLSTTNVVQGVQLSSFNINWDDLKTVFDSLASQIGFYWTVDDYWGFTYAPPGYFTASNSLICDNSSTPNLTTTFPADSFQAESDFSQPGSNILVIGAGSNVAQVIDPVQINAIGNTCGYFLPTTSSWMRKVNASSLNSSTDVVNRGIAEIIQYDYARAIYRLNADACELIAGQAIPVTSSTDGLSQTALLLQDVTATWIGTSELLQDKWQYQATLGAINRQVPHILSRLFRATNANSSAPAIATTALVVFEKIGITDTVNTSAGPLWYNTGYVFKRKITIDHTKVSGGANLSNFPVLISLTDASLKTVVNGGNIQNSSGYDIIFVDSTETARLNHEIESYTGSSGTVIIHLGIPTLSASTDTVIYMYFSNASISTSQENKPGVWDPNYNGVWHLKETSGTQFDSTSNANNLTSAVNATEGSATGKIDGADSFTSGHVSNVNAVDSATLRPTGDMTIELWVNFASIAVSNITRLIFKDASNFSYMFFQDIGPASFGFQWVNASNTVYSIDSVTAPSTSTWYHVVGVHDASANKLHIYVNGANDDAQNVTTTGTMYITGPANFYVGSSTSINAPNAIIDEVRLSSVVRSTGWIATEYANQNNPSVFYSIGAITSQSASSYRVLIMNDGAVAYYRLGELEGTTADDFSGNAYQGTLHGGVTLGTTGLITGDSDTAMTFNGSTGYISLPTSWVPTGAAVWSIEAWIKISSIPASGFHAIVGMGNATGNQRFGVLTLNSNGTTAQIVLSTNSGDISSYNIATNTIYHALGTYDGANTRLYVNGGLVAGPSAFTLNLTQSLASIGAYNNASFFSGIIDEPAFYTTILTAQQATIHYCYGGSLYANTILQDTPVAYFRLGEPNGSTVYDISGNTYTGSIVGGVTLGATGPHPHDSNTSMTFNGSTGWINGTISALTSGSGAWSIEGWANFSSLSGAHINTIVTIGTWNVNNQSAFICVDTAGKAQVGTFGGNHSSSTTISTATWYHVVGTYDGTNMNLYVNGSLVLGPIAQTMSLTGTSFAIASKTGSVGNQATGSLDEIAVYNYALTAAQILNHYTVGST